MNLKQLTVIIAILFGIGIKASSHEVRGTVTDRSGNPIPYVSVFVMSTTHGVVTNLKGQYFLQLSNGRYGLVFRAMGYKTDTVEVTVDGQNLVRDVTLSDVGQELEGVTIESDRRDPAYAIMKNVVRNKKKYLKQIDEWSRRSYVKASLEKEPRKQDPGISVDMRSRERMNLIESWSKVYYRHPGKLKEVREGYNDLAERGKAPGMNFGISFEVGENDPDPGEEWNEQGTPYLFYLNASEASFNFYRNLVDVPKLGLTPFVSPVSSGGLLSYKFKLEESFYEEGRKIYRIRVIPRRSEGALFDGEVFIVDSTWAIKAVDLTIDPSALSFFNYFKVIQQYEQLEDSVWMPVREEFFYNARDGRNLVIGSTMAIHSEYNLKPELERGFFRNEVLRTEDGAYDRDSAFWEDVRPITLKEEELAYIRHQDSIYYWTNSEDFKDKNDSIYNRTTVWDVLFFGMGYKNWRRGEKYYVNPLFFGARPFGVGGYRHSIGGELEREIGRSKAIRLAGDLDYGFKNSDVKGNIELAYLYNPKRFSEVRIKYGDEYTMVNTYESIAATFSRSNYVRKIHYHIGHETEIMNGLFFDVETEWAERKSISNLSLAQWSQDLFGDLNVPQDFNPYKEWLWTFRLKFKPFQKYHMEPDKKVVIGTDWPVFQLKYKKAVPGVAGSTINYDFLELQASHDFTIGTFGESKVNLYTGRYVNSENVQFTDYKFFRGSDRYFFSNPLKSYQLLGPTLSTINTYLQMNYIHQFHGAIMNKIPLINKLGLEVAAGAGLLLIEDNGFRHGEAFVGLQWPFKIKKQRMRLGVYYVGADSNYSDADGTFKIGIDFYNSFRNTWTY